MAVGCFMLRTDIPSMTNLTKANPSSKSIISSKQCHHPKFGRFCRVASPNAFLGGGQTFWGWLRSHTPFDAPRFVSKLYLLESPMIGT
jgi:hypothetical protein